jgi:hypothetical protein
LVSHGLWKRLWGGESNVLGQTLSLDSVPATIIGVLPPSIGPLSRADVLIPLRLSVNDTSGWYLGGVGRLKPGIASETARQDLTRIHKAMIPNRPANEITSPRLTPLRQRLLGDYRSGTYILIAAVAVVWLIACANVAGLMLARGLARGKEIGIRMALGAQRSDVLRLVLRHGMSLAGIGVVIGLGGAFALTRVMRTLLVEVRPADPLTFSVIPVPLAAVTLLACLLPALDSAQIGGFHGAADVQG